MSIKESIGLDILPNTTLIYGQPQTYKTTIALRLALAFSKENQKSILFSQSHVGAFLDPRIVVVNFCSIRLEKQRALFVSTIQTLISNDNEPIVIFDDWNTLDPSIKDYVERLKCRKIIIEHTATQLGLDNTSTTTKPKFPEDKVDFAISPCLDSRKTLRLDMVDRFGKSSSCSVSITNDLYV